MPIAENINGQSMAEYLAIKAKILKKKKQNLMLLRGGRMVIVLGTKMETKIIIRMLLMMRVKFHSK